VSFNQEGHVEAYRETAQTAPKRQGGYRISNLAAHVGTVLRWIKQQPDLTLAKLQQRCARELTVSISVHALWYRLERLGLSFKKTTRGAEQDRRDLVLKRRQWKADQPFWDARKLVFIDEMGVNTQMARRYGRSAVGERCQSAEPHGHGQSSTFLAA
jgi:transposase